MNITVAISITEEEISWSDLFSYIFLQLQSITLPGLVNSKIEIWIYELRIFTHYVGVGGRRISQLKYLGIGKTRQAQKNAEL
jgi:hypothetical protein